MTKEEKRYQPKNLYICLDIDCRGMKYSYVWKVNDSENLVYIFESLFEEFSKRGEKVMSANIWPKNIALSTSAAWNEEWKKQDCYYWDHFVDYDRVTGQPIFDVAV